MLREHESRSSPTEDDFSVAIWEETGKNSPEETLEGAQDADSPLSAIDLGHLEGTATDKNNDDLTPNHDAVDANEEPVFVHTFEDIKFVVKPLVVVLVEDLHPHKRVEDHCVQLLSEFRTGFEVVGEYLFGRRGREQR